MNESASLINLTLQNAFYVKLNSGFVRILTQQTFAIIALHCITIIGINDITVIDVIVSTDNDPLCDCARCDARSLVPVPRVSGQH